MPVSGFHRVSKGIDIPLKEQKATTEGYTICTGLKITTWFTNHEKYTPNPSANHNNKGRRDSGKFYKVCAYICKIYKTKKCLGWNQGFSEEISYNQNSIQCSSISNDLTTCPKHTICLITVYRSFYMYISSSIFCVC